MAKPSGKEYPALELEKSRKNVQELDDSDDKTRKQEHLQRIRRICLSGIPVVIINFLYFTYRIKRCLSGVPDLSGTERAVVWSFLAIELGLAWPGIMLSVLGITEYTKVGIRPSLRLTGSQVPTVDVLIPCCGESVDTIMNTVLAACALDYPADRFRVVLLDDGNSSELRKRIDEVKANVKNLFYGSRGAKITVHSKSANLNFGLDLVDKQGPSEYVAIVDADVILMPSFLRALMPHLLVHPSCVMAAVPQNFYNMHDGDPLDQNMAAGFNIHAFFGELEDGTFSPGTGIVVRRSAVDEIGKFPTDHVMEDMLTTLLFWQKGWQVTYSWEPLQWGTVPETYASHTSQFNRWWKGFTSLAFIVLFGTRLPTLTMQQRLRFAGFVIGLVGPVIWLGAAMVFIPTVLLSGKAFIIESGQELRILLILSVLQIVATWVNGYATSVAIKYQSVFWPPYRHTHLSLYQTLALLGLDLPLRLKGNYRSSGSVQSGDRGRRSSLIQRLADLLSQPASWFYLLVISSIVTGATRFAINTFDHQGAISSYQLQKFLTGPAWPPAFSVGLVFICDCSRPLWYLVFPPKGHSQEQLLKRNTDTKAAYPTEFATDPKRTKPSQGLSYVILAFAIFILAYVRTGDAA